jgi:hypothetical protein
VAILPWPNPIPGQPDQIVIDGMPMQLVPGKYSVEEADRFGEKVSQGTLKYADFNPYESAHAVAAFTGGAGLRRYTDAGDDPSKVATLYTESNNVNCAFAPAVLSPQVSLYALPGAVKPAVWIGENWRSNMIGEARRLVAIAEVATGTGVFSRQTTGPWQLDVTIPAKFGPIGAACGIYNGILIVGFGSAYLAASVDTAGVVGQVLQGPGEAPASAPLYVWAYTSDHAANYIAGGPSNSHYFRVMSSVAPASLYAVPVSCGDTLINGLAPGGGLVLVYVGKVDALGCIDNEATYHDLIPFDSRLDTNCRPLKWLLASGADQARGSLALVFPRERSLWEYAPSDQFSGTASCIAPWSMAYRRPPNARGTVTAIQGSSRWLYYAVQNSAGNTWIYKNDQTTGAPHTYLYLGHVDVRAMQISHMFTGNPLLFFSYGNQMGQVTLPMDGDAEFDDTNCRYAMQGYLDMPDIDLGFPDEDKIGFSVRVIADDIVSRNRYIRVEASIDGEPYIELGYVTTSPSGEVRFPLGTTAKRIALRLWMYTDDAGATPKLWGVSCRVSLNTKTYRLFVFQTKLPSGSFNTLADDLQNPYLQIIQSWRIRAKGVPIPYQDPWNDPYQVRLLKFQQQQALREPDRSPEWVLDWTLLEFLAGEVSVGDFVYDMAWTIVPDADQQELYAYDQELALYDSQQPSFGIGNT